MDTKQVIVNGIATRYTINGSGKVIVMLHGWGDSLATFHELAESLSNRYQVICLDLPGFGQTDAPDKAWGVNDYATFVRAFTTKLDVSVYALLGHSHGGAVAIHAVGAKQWAVDRLILLGAAGVRNKLTAKKTALKAGAKTAKLLTVALPKSTKQRLRSRLYGVIGSDMTTVPHMEETFRQVVADDQTNIAREIHTPTLLIYGQEDQSTPPSDGAVLQQCIVGSKLEVLADAGHFVHHDKSTQVSKLIEGFLE